MGIKPGIRGFGKKDKESPGADRGWLGHEGDYAKEGDTYGDHEHMHRVRFMNKDGDISVHQGSSGSDQSKSEFGQNVADYEERFKHKENNAGVLLAAAGSDEEVHHGAQNKYMDRAASTGAKRTWKPKGRAAAEAASRDVKGGKR